MLNEKLIEVYGEESRDLFNELITHVGEDKAFYMYAYAGSIDWFVKSKFPLEFGTSLVRNAVDNKIGEFAKKHGRSSLALKLTTGRKQQPGDISLLCDKDENMTSITSLESLAYKLLDRVQRDDIKVKLNEKLKTAVYSADDVVTEMIMEIDNDILVSELGMVFDIVESPYMHDENSHQLADWIMQKTVAKYVVGAEDMVRRYQAVNKDYSPNV